MSRILRPDQYGDEVDALWQAIRGLKTAPTLNNSAIQEGSTVITDASGVKRVLLGKYTSDASYGIKVFDSFGALQFDANGQRQVMTRIAFADASPQNQNITGTTGSYVDVAWATTT